MTFITPIKSLNKAYLKLPVLASDADKFRAELCAMEGRENPSESEEYYKNLVTDFLKNVYYSPDYMVNTSGRYDSAIYNGATAESRPAVIIEMKSPSNRSEMCSAENMDAKALHETLLYFLREYVTNGNRELKKLIITSYEEWFVFDARTFADFLAGHKELLARYEKFTGGQMTDSRTSTFYEDIAPEFCRKLIESDCQCVHFRMQDMKRAFSDMARNEKEAAAFYKFFSPENLLGVPFANDSNSLDRGFYEELLHIIGLEEISEGGKKLIVRKREGSRDWGSLMESAIYQLETQHDGWGAQTVEEAAMRLCILWINRLLFLKLLESQQLSYQNKSREYRFLDIDFIGDFDELNELFFSVLAKRPEERHPSIREKYRNIPYLNSSLFEESEAERESSLLIRGLKSAPMRTFPSTVLRDSQGKKISGRMDTLEYIFRFLDAYNFASDGNSEIQRENKTLINASVLGLIFEKINGYKDGSFFTPGAITGYMAEQTVERAAIEKFNGEFGLDCKTLTDLANEIGDRIDRKKAAEVFSRMRILDPAAGSGHFLVSCLNRMVAIKSRLGILFAPDGTRIKPSEFEVSVENDELSVTDETGGIYRYNFRNSESRKVQEALFHAKKEIIEGCLFGADINPNSVEICRLRLWIELLKNTHYTAESGYTQLETLPNIDINIKCGNSLVSKYGAETGTSITRTDAYREQARSGSDMKNLVKEYRELVAAYKRESSKSAKRGVRSQIAKIKESVYGHAQLSLFEEENEEIRRNDIFRGSLEWMFEFPEVLDDDGVFLGFDVVIGNPPYFNIQTFGAKSQMLEYLPKRYKEIYQDKSDILFYFIYLGLALSRGETAFIISNAMLNSAKASKLRNYILEKSNLHKLVNFERNYIFPEASITTMMLFMNKEKYRQTKVLNFKEENISEKELPKELKKKKSINVKFKADSNFALVSSSENSLVEKIDSNHPKLEDLFFLGKGMETAANNVFMFKEYPNQFPKEFIKRRMVGEHIKKYFFEPTEVYLLYIEDVENFDDLPESVKNHLIANRGFLENRATVKNEGRVWWRYSRPMHKEYYHLNKIWCSYRNTKNEFAFDNTAEYIGFTNTTVIFDTNKDFDLKYLLALLNSKVLQWRYQHGIGKQTGGGVFEYFAVGVGKLPIPRATKEQQAEIVKLVDKILAAKKSNPNADTSELEKEIDAKVYELYGLAEDI